MSPVNDPDALERFELRISRETEWRKRELTSIRFMIAAADENTRKFLLRAGITFVYSHWEGWVKTAGKRYIEFVNAQKLTINELRPELAAAVLKPRVKEAGESENPKSHADLLRFLDKQGDEVHPVKPVFVNTESNLSSKVMNRIVDGLGLADDFSLGTKSNLIDEKLVGERNRIAHGEFRRVDQEQFDEIYYPVLQLLDEFTEALLNVATEGRYRRLR